MRILVSVCSGRVCKNVRAELALGLIERPDREPLVESVFERVE